MGKGATSDGEWDTDRINGAGDAIQGSDGDDGHILLVTGANVEVLLSIV